MRQYIDILKNIMKVAGRKKHLNFLLFGSSATYNLIGLLPPIATAGIIREIVEETFSGIWLYVGMYIGFYVLYFGFMRLNNYIYTKLAEYYHINLQERVFKNVESHPELFDKMPRGQIMDTFADDVRWMVDGINVGTEALLQVIRLVIIFVIFLTQDFTTGVIAVLVDVLYLLLLNGNAKEEAKRYANARKQEDKVISAFSEMVNIKEEVLRGRREELGVLGVASEERVAGVEEAKTNEQWEKMEKVFPWWRREYRKKRRVIANRNTLWASLPYFGKIVLYVLLGKMVIDGIMRLDTLVLLIGYFEMTITCMDKMTTHLLELSNYGVRVERLKKLL